MCAGKAPSAPAAGKAQTAGQGSCSRALGEGGDGGSERSKRSWIRWANLAEEGVGLALAADAAHLDVEALGEDAVAAHALLADGDDRGLAGDELRRGL